MKPITTYALAALMTAAAGCAQHKQPEPPPGPLDSLSMQEVDIKLTNTIRDQSVYNAIITQHTFYPYHFVTNGDTLNTLGQRDLAALADHYRLHPGDVTVRRGDTPADLYDARVHSVTQMLAQAGVDTDRIKIGDGLPGGPGLQSDNVVKILAKKPPSYESTSAGSINDKINEDQKGTDSKP